MLYTRNQYSIQILSKGRNYTGILNPSVSFKKHIWVQYNPAKTIQHNIAQLKIQKSIKQSIRTKIEIEIIAGYRNRSKREGYYYISINLLCIGLKHEENVLFI